jgi:hypothetical protein
LENHSIFFSSQSFSYCCHSSISRYETNSIVHCYFSLNGQLPFEEIIKMTKISFIFIHMFTISVILHSLCNPNFPLMCFISHQRTSLSIYYTTGLMIMYSLSSGLSKNYLFYLGFFLVILGFELRVLDLSHATSPFYWLLFR